MGSLKTLAIAGAVAMIATSAAFIAPASAADLMPPPMMAPPPPVMDSGSGGFYLRGDVGVGHMGESTMTSTFNVAVPGVMFDKRSFDSVAFAGAGIGYQFNPFLRVDVTGEYRTNSKISAIQSYTDAVNCVSGRCYDSYYGSLRSTVALVNGYIDLGTWHGITPFVGAGFGLANHRITGLYDIGLQPAGGFGHAADKSKTTAAWALMTGVGVDVTRNLKMEIGYRYLNMGSLSSNVLQCQNTPACPGEVQKYKVQSHDVKIGFRYMFDDGVAAAPAPVMAMGAAPLVRKY